MYRLDVDGRSARITMTMTSPACPLRDYLQDLVESTITARVPDAAGVIVEIVDEPPWTEDLMSDAAAAVEVTRRLWRAPFLALLSMVHLRDGALITTS